jgi:histidinol-phosphate aminotransferase
MPIARLLAAELALALGATPSSLHFFTMRVGNAQRAAAQLMARGLQVRDCTSFGHPDLVRVATRKLEDNQRLIEAWSAYLG